MAYPRPELKGRTAVVVGGSSGIGEAIAYGLAEAGAAVVPAARRPDEVNRVATQIGRIGQQSMAAVCDITDRDSIKRVLEAAVKLFGKIDILGELSIELDVGRRADRQCAPVRGWKAR